MKDRKIYKDESDVEVYQEIGNSDSIYKKYSIDAAVFKPKEDLQFKRQKLMAMKRRGEWLDFVIGPTNIYRLNMESFNLMWV